MEKFNYIIGYRWPDGKIGEYVIHNQTVFYGNAQDAMNTLDYIKRTCSNQDEKESYQIFKLV